MNPQALVVQKSTSGTPSSSAASRAGADLNRRLYGLKPRQFLGKKPLSIYLLLVSAHTQRGKKTTLGGKSPVLPQPQPTAAHFSPLWSDPPSRLPIQAELSSSPCMAVLIFIVDLQSCNHLLRLSPSKLALFSDLLQMGAMGDSGGKVRLIQCPKCENLLLELADYSVYQCGGCGAVLGAKKERQMSGSGCLRFLMVIANQCHKSMFFLSYQLNFRIKPISAINLHKVITLSFTIHKVMIKKFLGT
ncbi:hypothetical protein RchiOBHm_Chr7g0243711 [Rosa chinensis]|uniref:Enhanced disease resistance 4-like N-terminal domain-containing protein n=1 Tax=Rosa chinensis TaxID=74649 RepID=A0A2P6PIT2_ROSCH|nr:hypothetical protein RchiOBHm_Chr7g0243711 [Rosa chinensis]